MQVAIRHNPSFSVARLTLAPGEPAKAESGAMAAMSPDMNVQAQLPGDIVALPASPDRAWNLSKGSWLSNEWSVAIDTKWGASATWSAARAGS